MHVWKLSDHKDKHRYSVKKKPGASIICCVASDQISVTFSKTIQWNSIKHSVSSINATSKSEKPFANTLHSSYFLSMTYFSFLLYIIHIIYFCYTYNPFCYWVASLFCNCFVIHYILFCHSTYLQDHRKNSQKLPVAG